MDEQKISNNKTLRILSLLFLILIFSLIFFQLGHRLGTSSVAYWRGFTGGLIAGVASLLPLFVLIFIKSSVFAVPVAFTSSVIMFIFAISSGVYPEFESIVLPVPFFITFMFFYYLNKIIQKNISKFKFYFLFSIFLILMLFSIKTINDDSKNWKQYHDLANLLCLEDKTKDVNVEEIRNFCKKSEIPDCGSHVESSLRGSKLNPKIKIQSSHLCKEKDINYKYIDTTKEEIMSFWYNLVYKDRN